MKKTVTLLFITLITLFVYSCGDNGSVEEEQEVEPSDVPPVRSYTTYTSQNSVTLNGFIDNTNNYYQGDDTYKVGFIFRAGSEFDSSNDVVIELDEDVQYTPYSRSFSTEINSLEPNTTYYYTCYTKNGYKEKDDWKSFKTSAIPCTYTTDNYYSISGAWRTASVLVTNPQCCDSGSVGFQFGTWPNIFEINFYEIDDGYPITGQYFGIDYQFDLSDDERELTKSTNLVLITNTRSTPETELFVVNDGTRITLIFCDTVLRDGTVLNGKVSALIP